MKTKVLIKKLCNEVNIPEYKTTGSSGLDIEAFIEKDLILKPNETKLVPTGISVENPNAILIEIDKNRPGINKNQKNRHGIHKNLIKSTLNT